MFFSLLLLKGIKAIEIAKQQQYLYIYFFSIFIAKKSNEQSKENTKNKKQNNTETHQRYPAAGYITQYLHLPTIFHQYYIAITLLPMSPKSISPI